MPCLCYTALTQKHNQIINAMLTDFGEASNCLASIIICRGTLHMDHPVTNELVMRLRRATGLPFLEAKRLLTTKPIEEQHTYVEAVENAQNGVINDPIENDPEVGPIIKTVMETVATQVQEEHDNYIARFEQTSPTVADLFRSGRGLCQAIWHQTKQKLKNEHGIDWKTPAEMTPWIHID